MTPLFALIFAGLAFLSFADADKTARSVGVVAILLSLGLSLVRAALTAALAVVIHRFVILGEVAGVSDLPRLTPTILEFAAVTIVLQLVAALALLLVVPAWGWLGSPVVAALVFGVVFFLTVYAGLRIGLLFPAIAVEAPGRSVRSAFRDGDGLVLLLLMACALSALVIVVPGVVVGAALGSAPALLPLAGVAMEMALIAVSVAIVSQVFTWRTRQLAAWSEAR
ncbi:hypothetical protein ACFSCV_12435 [Methylopila henanensis]|uniref:Uncharacterized protein n=1 Tax=Methylopila henanensis TaxID=873516 RepID=A0ABW4KCI4_9HYPH